MPPLNKEKKIKLTLSHSAAERYETCAESYRLHYIEKIRPEAHGAALVFGNALDVALNELLKPTGKSPEEEFEKALTSTIIAGTACYVPTYENIVYPVSNFDAEILLPSDFENVYLRTQDGTIQIAENLDSPKKQLAFYDNLKRKRKEEDGLTYEEKKYYNLLNWWASYRRGLLMLVAYRKDVMPHINEVLASQERINLKNEEGDEVTGIVDLVADIAGYGPVILDNKTSSMRYADDAVRESKQLGLYVHCLEEKYKTRLAGFIVLQKQIKKNRVKTCQTCGHVSYGRAATCDAEVNGKRCHGEWTEVIHPEIRVQILIDEIPESDQHKAIERLDLTSKAIHSKVFERNLQSCDNQYGSPCAYRGLCFGGNMHGLIDLKKDKNGESSK